jgi:tripartite ATP-independent transporter DctM subunit
VLYLATVAVMARIWLAPGEGAPPAGGLGPALRRVAPAAVLFALVIGGLYGGAFTPTEAGGAGAALALLIALWRRTPLAELRAAVVETVAITGALFVILIGAEVFGYLLSVSRLSFALVDAIREAGWTPWQVLLVILALYIVLGCVMESLAMILITVPIFYPLVMEAGFDPVWFGVLAVVTVETGLISPPFGLNLYVVRAAAPGLGLRPLMIGVLPFLVADILRLAILVAVPALALWLPGRL